MKFTDLPASLQASKHFVPAMSGTIKAAEAVEAALDGDESGLVEILAGAYIALVLASRQPKLRHHVEVTSRLLEAGDPQRPRCEDLPESFPDPPSAA